MKRLTGFIGAALAVLLVAWFVMLLAGAVYPVSYEQSLHTLSILYIVTALLRKAD
jgi:CDP-diglyceride synthetase